MGKDIIRYADQAGLLLGRIDAAEAGKFTKELRFTGNLFDNGVLRIFGHIFTNINPKSPNMTLVNAIVKKKHVKFGLELRWPYGFLPNIKNTSTIIKIGTIPDQPDLKGHKISEIYRFSTNGREQEQTIRHPRNDYEELFDSLISFGFLRQSDLPNMVNLETTQKKISEILAQTVAHPNSPKINKLTFMNVNEILGK